MDAHVVNNFHVKLRLQTSHASGIRTACAGMLDINQFAVLWMQRTPRTVEKREVSDEHECLLLEVQSRSAIQFPSNRAWNLLNSYAMYFYL